MNGTLGRLRGLGPTLALAALAGAAGVVGSYAAAGFTPSFVVAPIDGYLAAVAPGAVVTFAITVLGDLGQRVALLTAVALAVVTFGGLSLLGLIAGREFAVRADRPHAGPLVGPFAGALGVAALAFLLVPSVAPALSAGGAAAAVLVVGEAGRRPSTGASPEGRRTVLTGLAGALGVGLVGYLLGGSGARGSNGTNVGSTGSAGESGAEAAGGSSAGADGSMDPDVQELLDGAAERTLPVEGIEPLVSERFYNVDINSVNPRVRADSWSLRVTGAVEREFDLDYQALTVRESREEFVTLRCVGDTLNGQKMDNALWTVTDIEPLLEEAGVTADSEQCCVQLHGADDYYVAFPLSALREGMLAYRMN
ncbi:MAG: molybdopterin-dependent oxidoreductase, partial [Haloarculaceae archaeon]